MKTIRAISRDACKSYLLGKRSFVDVFSDWLLEKGIKIDDETYWKISDLHFRWYTGKWKRGMGYHQLAEAILEELKIEVN